MNTDKNKHLRLDYFSPVNLLLTVLLLPLDLVFIRYLEGSIVTVNLFAFLFSMWEFFGSNRGPGQAYRNFLSISLFHEGNTAMAP
jgi:hypothetical protein